MSKWLVLKKVTVEDPETEAERWAIVVVVEHAIDEAHAAACGAEWDDPDGTYKALPWNDRQHRFPAGRVGPALDRSLRRSGADARAATRD